MAYTELSSSLMKRTAEISLDYNKSKRSASLSFSGGASSMDLLGSALGGAKKTKAPPKKKVRQTSTSSSTSSSSSSAPSSAPNPFKRRSTKPVHMWTTAKSSSSTTPSASNPTKPVDPTEKTWAQIEAEVAYGFGSRICPNCFSKNISEIGGGVGSGHRASGMSTHKAETWGRKDDGGVIIVLSCVDCGLRFEDET